MPHAPLVISTTRHWAPLGLAAILTASGVAHFVRPEAFLPLVPRGLPAPGAIVAISGLLELMCAAGLVTRRSWAGPASAALLIAIFPGNIQFALDRAADSAADPLLVVGAWLRLPLQLPLIWAAFQGRRTG